MYQTIYHQLDFYGFFESISKAIEAKDSHTAGHSKRVSNIVNLLALELGFSEYERECLNIAAHLHDIGKIGIPDGILLKHSSLTKAEYMVIQQHPVIGANIVKDIKGFERIAMAIRHHHERFDGSGYPDRLSSQDIPLDAAIIAVADVFDAMTTYRPYKNSILPDVAYNQLLQYRGKLYHPLVVDAFSSVYVNKYDLLMNIIYDGDLEACSPIAIEQL
ncbi:MAG: HD-GYP domain-containing protein [Spirochaetes bacterium]|nr:HD-GYP domain-containing protein [Spirochaetota bacterium]